MSADSTRFETIRGVSTTLTFSQGVSRPPRSRSFPSSSPFDDADIAGLPAGFENALYCRTVYLANNASHHAEGAPRPAIFTEEVRKSLKRMAAYVDKQSAGSGADGRLTLPER